MSQLVERQRIDASNTPEIQSAQQQFNAEHTDFTNAEKEHLTYVNFLQDWEAFVKHPEFAAAVEKDGLNGRDDVLSLDVALAFLKEMQ